MRVVLNIPKPIRFTSTFLYLLIYLVYMKRKTNFYQMIILQLFYIRVCQEFVNIILFFFSIPGNYFFILLILFCHKLSPFLQGWQRRKKRFVYLKQKTNICCIALFWPVTHDCLMTACSFKYPRISDLCAFFAFKSKS